MDPGDKSLASCAYLTRSVVELAVCSCRRHEYLPLGHPLSFYICSAEDVNLQILPTHADPLSSNPSSHSHLKEPSVLTQ